MSYFDFTAQSLYDVIINVPQKKTFTTSPQLFFWQYTARPEAKPIKESANVLAMLLLNDMYNTCMTLLYFIHYVLGGLVGYPRAY